jgi:hypothetical protein
VGVGSDDDDGEGGTMRDAFGCDASLDLPASDKSARDVLRCTAQHGQPTSQPKRSMCEINAFK